MKIKHFFPLVFLSLFFLLTSSIVIADNSILIVELNGTINQASVELVKYAIDEAENQGDEAIILTLNTPGGGVAETFTIASFIQNSSVPVIGFVYPSGGYAWSAGTFILLSTHLAAMMDYTIIGSCQPVEISIEGSRPINDSKTINALVTWLQERALMYGRNATLAKEFITLNRNVNASQALSLNAIEFTASSIKNLLQQINGSVVQTSQGNKTIITENAISIAYTPPIQVVFLSIISNPLLTSLLFMLGIFALFIGISSPGYGAEVVGVISILLSLFGSGFSVPELSLIFLAIGAVLLLIEFFITPGFGIIGFGGIICFIVGSIFLIPTYSSREWVITMDWINNLIIIIVATGVLLSIFFIFLLYKILEIRTKKKATGVFIGETAITIDALIPDIVGYVRFKGELWKAKSKYPIGKDEKVTIIEKDGTILFVEPLNTNPKH